MFDQRLFIKPHRESQGEELNYGMSGENAKNHFRGRQFPCIVTVTVQEVHYRVTWWALDTIRSKDGGQRIYRVLHNCYIY